MKLPSKSPRQLIKKGLEKLTTDQQIIVENSIPEFDPLSLVSIDTTKILKKNIDKSFSVRLIKWVESYLQNGIQYSLFYTEVNHNLKVGDKVYIVGGNYDTETLRDKKKTNPLSNGYTVLSTDRCKVVLNIPYTGIQPTNEEPLDNFTKLYTASDDFEFISYLNTWSARIDGDYLRSRFYEGTNNFLVLNGTYSITPGQSGILGFTSSTNLSTNQTTHGNCVLYRRSDDYLVDITFEFMSGSFSSYLSPTATNNGKVKVMNNDLVVSNQSFKNGYVYVFDGNWKIDKTFLPVFITEQNFTNGIFISGEWNQGLFGRHEEKITWDGSNVSWNMGTVLNATWVSGVLDSTIEQKESYFTVIDRNGFPQIRSNSSNNGGSGYNYVFDTDFIGGDVINGNIYNMAVIYGTNSNVSQMDNYLTTGTPTYSVNLTAGVYYNSDIIFAKISNSTFISSYVLNSYVENCKSVNSEIEASIFESSTYLADNVIKIQSYQEGNVNWYDPNSNISQDYKLYKFYITENSFNRISEFQNFYFQGLKINEDTTDPLHFWDDKFTLGQYYRSVDDLSGKTYSQVIIQLSTSEDNRNQVGVINGASNSLVPNFYPLPSVDIMIYGGPNFNYGSTNSYPRPYLGNILNVEDAYILEADFISGIFQNSKWVSGNYINYNIDHSLSLMNSLGEYQSSNILATTQSIIMPVGSSLRPPIFKTDTSGSNIAFINHLKYDFGSSKYSLNDSYRVISTGNDYVLQDLGTSSPIQLIPNGLNTLISPRIEMKYNYLHPVKFINSEFRSGVFVRGYFENCVFYNPALSKPDKTLKDLSLLRDLLISDTIFANNNNKLIGQTIQKSSVLGGNDIWYGGLFYNGLWDGESYEWGTQSFTKQMFKSGVFTKSNWKDGDFISGDFYLNSSNSIDSTIFSNNIQSTSHYNNRWSWIGGDFKGGNFELSNWETGNFIDGNFYNSNFYTGTATGGNFGKSYLASSDTKVYSGDFTKIKVENANFITEDPINITPIVTNITIRNSIFESGILSNNDSKDPLGITLSTIWENGIFNSGEFGGSSRWLDGTFNGGKFTSRYGLDFIYSTPNTLLDLPQTSYSWQSGIFNGGEFGNAQLGTNSIWFTGEFNGGVFQGKYWRNGIFTGGEFNGINLSTSTELWEPIGQVGINPTDIYSNYIGSYYGYWNDGVVSESKDKFIKDQKLYSVLERESTKREKISTTQFNNMFWRTGTFSHNEGVMLNSIFYSGIWEEGKFKQSHFNPYIQILNDSKSWILSNLGSISYPSTINTFDLMKVNSSLPITWVEVDYVLSGGDFSARLEVSEFQPGGLIYAYTSTDSNILNIPTSNPIQIDNDGFYSFTFSSGYHFCLAFTGSGTFSFEVEIYPGFNKSGYRLNNDPIWTGGVLEDSYFDFSTWKNGEFLSGTATGMVWEGGVSEYMNAYNILWKSGTWRNGNWFGSPFKDLATYSSSYQVHPGQSEDIMNNIAQKSGTSSIHLNNVFNSVGFYSSIYNNELYDSISLNSPSIGQSIILPNVVDYTYLTGLNSITLQPDYIKSNFGNGQFISGVWENGSWIDGFRKDLVLLKSNGFTKVGDKNLAYQTSETEWTIGLDILTYESASNWSNIYQIGDKVSVGNIISIDLNGERRLLKDYLLVSKIDAVENRIELTVNINFPIVSIEWDSFDEEDIDVINPRHLIYITKNVWLNGNFYNGHFDEGVWNNGLFKGYPYVTEMRNSQWIDGIFKGGHFKGGTSSFVKNDDTSNGSDIHTALIQNMEFHDKNQRNPSGPYFTFKYNSWIDVVFDTDTGVNINKLNTVLGTQLDNIQDVNSIGVGITETYIDNHYYSFATKDVLSAQSHITNAYDNDTQIYNLGWKYKEYVNFLEEVGIFDNVINGGYTYNQIDQNNGTYIQNGDLDNFFDYGWTYSNKLGSSLQSIESNLSSIPQLLKLSGERSTSDPSTPNYKNYNLIKFDNTNVDIDKLRYSFVEVEVSSYLDPEKTYVYYNNYPAPYTVARQQVTIGGIQIFLPINQSIDASNETVARFYDGDLSGDYFDLKVGEFSLAELNALASGQGQWSGDINDRISSVEIILNDNKEYEVIIYQNNNYGGNNLVLSGSFPTTFNSTSLGFLNDKTSSIKVRPKTPKVITKREYFYNKPNLDLTILNNEIMDQRWSLYFKSIKYVEVDRIPFFDLGGEIVIKNNLITWDQMDSNNFVTWDQAGNPPDPNWSVNNTWDNLSFIQGNSENSYINDTIYAPTYSVSEKISFDNPNIDYLN